MKKILGISAFYHDSAAAILIDGKIIGAAQEERFTRKKHTADFPENAIKYCLQEANLTLKDLDAIAFYDKPFLKFERLLETYMGFAPKGLISFISAIPVWLNEKLFLKRLLIKGLKRIEKIKTKEITLLFPEHHLSHAASAFYPSNYPEAAILTIDGVGEWCTTSISFGSGNKITKLRELHFPHSLGLLYSSFTYYLGFKVNSGEYKLMGLAPYGKKEAQETILFKQRIKSELIQIYTDGSIWLNQAYFKYATGLKMTNNKRWHKLLGIPRRLPTEDLKQSHCNLALAIQEVTEEVVLKLARTAKELTQSQNICLAGGVALNCVANGKLYQENLFQNIYIQPASGDAGGALGAALAGEHIYFQEERNASGSFDQMSGAFLGPEYGEHDIIKVKGVSKPLNLAVLADLIAKGNVVGWFQGRMEFGPRALGNRSILGDPRNTDMQRNLNLKIKLRESFRPFAPIGLQEDIQSYFKFEDVSPYMLMVADLRESKRKAVPELENLLDRVHQTRSEIPAVTHIDYSGRIQTVDPETNAKMVALLKEFKKITGIGILINTSFNVRGEPIVCTPTDAYHCFMQTEMDYLVIEDHLFKKEDQPEWDNKKKWNRLFKED